MNEDQMITVFEWLLLINIVLLMIRVHRLEIKVKELEAKEWKE